MGSVGVSFALVSLLSTLIALRGRDEAASQQGAVAQVAGEPWGKALLVVIALGLLAYAGWGLVCAATGEAVEDQEDRGPWTRLAYGARGVFYAALAVGALGMALRGSGGGQEQEQTASLLSLPAGRWIVGGVGVALIVSGLANAYWGLSGRFKDQMRTWEIPRRRERLLSALSRFSLVSRLLVFGLIGVFLVRAAVQHDPTEAKGLDDALAELARTPLGTLLLLVVAAGLVSYAVFRLMEARYRKL